MKGLIKKVRENKKGFTLAELLVVSYRITCNNGNQRTLINP